MERQCFLPGNFGPHKAVGRSRTTPLLGCAGSLRGSLRSTISISPTAAMLPRAASHSRLTSDPRRRDRLPRRGGPWVSRELARYKRRLVTIEVTASADTLYRTGPLTLQCGALALHTPQVSPTTSKMEGSFTGLLRDDYPPLCPHYGSMHGGSSRKVSLGNIAPPGG